MASISGVWIISEESYTNVAASETITYPVDCKIDLSQSDEMYSNYALYAKDFVSIQLITSNFGFMRLDTSGDYCIIYSSNLPIALDFGTGQIVDDELYTWLTENATSAAEPEQPTWTFNLRDFLSGMATAAASRGVLPRRVPIGYSYNGVVLPELPEYDAETYTHVAIAYNSTYGVYQLLLKTVAFTATGTSDTISGLASVYYTLLDGVWTEPGYAITGTAVWANHDISNDNGVVLEASEPIPVYE